MTTTPPVPPAEDPGVVVRPPRSRRTWYVVSGVVGVVAVVGGAATWAATSFFSTGPQPAVALPSSTVAYVSIDLDPNGSEKIAAFKLLRRFPALAKQLGSVDDIREKAVDGLVRSSGCQADYAHDVKPWIGDRAGLGLVGTDPVIALQVTDDTKAEAGLRKLASCLDGHDASSHTGFVVDGDWALVAPSQQIATKAHAAAAKGNLADDVAFKKWTKAAGDPGIATFYVSPAISGVIGNLFSLAQSVAPSVSGLPHTGSGSAGSLSSAPAAPSQAELDALCAPQNLSASFTKQDCEKLFSDVGSSATGGAAAGGSSSGSSGVPGLGALSALGGLGSCGGSDPATSLKHSFASFKGAAGTLRVRGSGFELAEVSGTTSDAGGQTGHQVITSLPGDTAAAASVALPQHWGASMVAALKKACGASFDPAKLFDPITKLTGLVFPDDLETLLGTSTAISVGSGLDPEKLANSSDLSDLPVGIKVTGDPAKIKAVLAKLHLPPGFQAAYTDAGAVLSPDASYSAQLAKSGDLGSDSTFKDLVPNADESRFVLYVDGARFRSAVAAMAGGDTTITDNFDHFTGLGISSSQSGDEQHVSVRVDVR